jgi:hypothetical protein
MILESESPAPIFLFKGRGNLPEELKGHLLKPVFVRVDLVVPLVSADSTAHVNEVSVPGTVKEFGFAVSAQDPITLGMSPPFT